MNNPFQELINFVVRYNYEPESYILSFNGHGKIAIRGKSSCDIEESRMVISTRNDNIAHIPTVISSLLNTAYIGLELDDNGEAYTQDELNRIEIYGLVNAALTRLNVRRSLLDQRWYVGHPDLDAPNPVETIDIGLAQWTLERGPEKLEYTKEYHIPKQWRNWTYRLMLNLRESCKVYVIDIDCKSLEKMTNDEIRKMFKDYNTYESVFLIRLMDYKEDYNKFVNLFADCLCFLKQELSFIITTNSNPFSLDDIIEEKSREDIQQSEELSEICRYPVQQNSPIGTIDFF